MATSTPQDDYMKTALRLPRELHAKLMESAREAGRSLNGELVARLELSFGAQEQVSNEALMLEMRRTQLLLRRAQVQADASRAFFGGSDAAKMERAFRDANPDPADVEEAKRTATQAKLKAKHLSAELSGIDGRLMEIEKRLEDLGYAIDVAGAEHPQFPATVVLNKPGQSKKKR